MGKILVACEESQRVTEQMRLLGTEAYSCDLLPCSGAYPEWHIQHDVTDVLNIGWDMILAFPPCTHLTVTGNRWYNGERYGNKAVERYVKRKAAVDFFMMFANADCPYIAIENPIGIMSTQWRKPDQIIQPYQFGDPHEKRTCLWLKGLPPLKPTEIVQPKPRVVYKSGSTSPYWHAKTWKLPPAARTKARAKTFPGIARAMAEQWSHLIR